MSGRMETERLILAKWTSHDAAGLYHFANNPRVAYSAGFEAAKSLGDAKGMAKLLARNGAFKIIWKETGEIIGSVGLGKDKRREDISSQELGYWLSEEFWGRGIMTEAVEKVIEYAFCEMKLDLVSVLTEPSNIGSLRVIEKAGFRREGTERKAYKMYDGTIRDQVVFSMLREEYEEHRAALEGGAARE